MAGNLDGNSIRGHRIDVIVRISVTMFFAKSVPLQTGSYCGQKCAKLLEYLQEFGTFSAIIVAGLRRHDFREKLPFPSAVDDFAFGANPNRKGERGLHSVPEVNLGISGMLIKFKLGYQEGIRR